MEIQKHTFTEIMSIGKAFAESGMFADIKSAAQAMVKIQAGLELGIKPFAAMSGIHIISGKATIGAGLIASAIKGSGKYDYRIIEQSDKVCKIEFFQGKESIGVSSFTIEEAKKAGTKNLDKFPANMLFARAISNGVKWFTPDVFQGPVYVPEEMGAIVTEEVEAEVLPDYDDVIEAINNAVDKAELTSLWKALPKEMRAASELIETFKAKAASYV
jgi:hypothetical protein